MKLSREVTLEERILSAYDVFLSAAQRKDPKARDLWQRFCQLHAMRSPLVIEQMERAKGLI